MKNNDNQNIDSFKTGTQMTHSFLPPSFELKIACTYTDEVFCFIFSVQLCCLLIQILAVHKILLQKCSFSIFKGEKNKPNEQHTEKPEVLQNKCSYNQYSTNMIMVLYKL